MMQEENKSNSIVWYKHVMVSFFYVAIFLVCLGMTALSSPYQYTVPIKSAQREFNNSDDPYFFIHLSDVHVSEYHNKNVENYKKAIQWIYNAQADDVVVSGDLVDNWERKWFLKSSKQNQEDHKLYVQITKDFAKHLKNLVDISGNHDEFGLISYDSPQHEFLDYSSFYHKRKNITYEDFTVTTHDLNDNFVLLLINCAVYPTSRALVDLFVDSSTELLDRIEDAFEELQKKNKQIIVVTHFPAGWWMPRRSSNGKTFEEMFQQYDAVLLTGHVHPTNYNFVHIADNVEIVASDLKIHDHLGMVTFDNGNFIFHQFDLKDELKAVVTNPPSYKHLARQTIFNLKTMPIRLLVWSNKEEEIFVDIDDLNKKQKMIPVRKIKENITLYELNCTLEEEGYHTLNFSGFYSDTLEFYNGETLPSFKEETGSRYNLFFSIPKAYNVFIFILLITIFPFNIESFFPTIQKKADELLNTMYTEEMPWKMFFFYLFCGPLITRWKIQKVHKSLCWTLLVIALSPYFVPVFVQNLDGHIGIVTIYGYSNSGISRLSIYGPFFRIIHMASVLWPLIILTGFLSCCLHKREWTKAYIIDIACVFIGIGESLFVVVYRIPESTDYLLALSSPLFTYEYLLMIPLILVEWNNRKKLDNINRLTSKDDNIMEEMKIEEKMANKLNNLAV